MIYYAVVFEACVNVFLWGFFNGRASFFVLKQFTENQNRPNQHMNYRVITQFFVLSHTPSNHQVSNPIDAVLPTILQPSLSAGKLLEFVASTVTSAESIKLLGKKATKLVNDIGSVAKNAGESLLGNVELIIKLS